MKESNFSEEFGFTEELDLHDDFSAEEIIAALDLQGILISGGAACASHSGQPSHVYTAMGLTPQQASRVIRVSIGRHTTQDELECAAQAIGSLIPPPARQNTSR